MLVAGKMKQATPYSSFSGRLSALSQVQGTLRNQRFSLTSVSILRREKLSELEIVFAEVCYHFTGAQLSPPLLLQEHGQQSDVCYVKTCLLHITNVTQKGPSMFFHLRRGLGTSHISRPALTTACIKFLTAPECSP